ncbi:MAG: VirB8/TrbF family protein [Pseudomonadota bacterium]
MFRIGDLFKKKEPNSQSSTDSSGDSPAPNQDIVTTARNWYEERYQNLVVQRNILALVLILSMVMAIVGVFSIASVATSKEFDPFVIQIDEQTGSTKVVNPISTELIDGNEALARYFIKRYVSAREAYNPVDFVYSRKIIRLLSTPSIFSNYLGYIRNKDNDPTVIYGQNNTTYITVKSWSKLDDKTYVVRFFVTETSGAMRVFSKIAVISIQYVAMELTNEADRDINPIGFQVTGYKVDDDNS